MFDLGDTWTLSCNSFDEACALANAETVTLTITVDGAALTGLPAVTNPPTRTGKYHYEHVPATAGRYVARWVLTYADGRSEAHSETLDVRPADPGGLISLPAAKAALDILEDSTADDAELRDWISAITAPVESIVGPCIVRPYEWTFTGAHRLWALPRYPVLELVSVTALDGSAAISPSDLLLIGPQGHVIRLNGGTHMCGAYRVVYVAGRPNIPGHVTSAAKMILRHLWTNQRGGNAGRQRMSMDDTELPAGFPWAVPKAAIDLLKSEPLTICGPMVG